MTLVKYSICMCNYNMSDTLERSLESILSQLDNNFEVILVDDGSSDESIKIIKKIQKKYQILKLIQLKREKKRYLGATRNISIKEAMGKYVLLNVDCDDIYGPFIKDFCEVFIQLEKKVGRDFYLKGNNINIGKRDFLLSFGPYRNISRLEDRDMWARLADKNAYFHLDHEDFVVRIPKTKEQRLYRSIKHTWEHMVIPFRFRPGFWETVKLEKYKWKTYSFKQKVLRFLFLPPAFIYSFFFEKIERKHRFKNGREFAKYRDAHRGSFKDLMKQHGAEPNYLALSKEGRDIFGK